MSNSFGNLLKVTIFGESHGEGIGVVLDGLPAGVKLDMQYISREMKRRAPGTNALSTPRKEADEPLIQSGIFEGRTTGAPLCAIIRNTNTRSSDYDGDILRPSHADYTGKIRYHGFNDYRGGGHFSGRITAPLVFAGAVCRYILEQQGVHLGAHILHMLDVDDAPFDPCAPGSAAMDALRTKPFPTLDDAAGTAMQQRILDAKTQGDSVGGVLECAVTGLPAGLGSPFFDSVESRLSAMLFSIPAVKGVQFGSGFAFADMYGSEANDAFYMDGSAIRTRTNHNAGINGGITNGMPVVFTVAVKPTPSIAKEQETVNYAQRSDTVMRVHGRHDPCIAHRAVCVIENAAAIVLLDLMLEAKTYAG